MTTPHPPSERQGKASPDSPNAKTSGEDVTVTGVLKEASEDLFNIGGRVIGKYLPRITGNRDFRPGSRPGVDLDDTDPDAPIVVKPNDVPTQITIYDFGPETLHKREIPLAEFAAFLREPRPEGAVMRWVNISGLNQSAVRLIARAKKLHPLAVEDVLNIPQRPKVEEFETETFIVGRMLQLVNDEIRSEQISMFARKGLVITFQESVGDVWDPIRERIGNRSSRLRSNGAGYLVYAMVDALVDHCFPILEHFGDRIEAIEEELLTDPSKELINRIHDLKRELILVRRVIWPMREVVLALQTGDHEWVGKTARTYLRDVYDHAVHVLDLMETYREMVGGLSDLYMNFQSNRMNEVMKVLTIIASLFIPVTFFAGVFGMNFQRFPELEWGWMYPWGFWIGCIAMMLGMLGWFKWKQWI